MTSALESTSAGRTPIGRRRLLRNSGLVISMGAIVAACGDGRTGLQEAGRVGNAPGPDPLPDAPVDDLLRLRTAQSLEYTALAVYDTARGLDVLDTAALTLVSRFEADHGEHADRLGELIVGAGGDEFTCPNPWIMSRVIAPILDAMEDSDDLARDVLNLAHAIESLGAATAQVFVGVLDDADLRREIMLIGAVDARHAATLAMAITGTPEGYVSPGLAGEEVEPDEAGIPIAYAIPSTFGQLTAQELVVGARDAGGARFSVLLQTPAENSFVYEFMSC